MNQQLAKIGPGLGPRINIWQKVYVWLSNFNLEPLTDLEKDVLRRLANGLSWSEFIPIEWRNVYSAIYDEYHQIVIDEKEKIKIDKDVPRTFTLFARSARYLRLNFPEDMSHYYQALTIVLQLASIGRGYCQGVNFIAAELLLELADPKEAFIILSFILKNCQLEILFDSRYSALFDYMRIFEKKLRKFNNKLYKHLKKCEFRASSYAIEWFTTCFIVTCPGEIACCIIDMILGGLNDIMIRMGLSILTTLQHRLIRLDFEKLHETFKDYCMKADVVYVVVQALKIQFQADNSVLKAMARKIETLDPNSGGDLMFGKSAKNSPPRNNVPRNGKNRKSPKQKSSSIYPSDDSLSEEGEMENDSSIFTAATDAKPIQIVLQATEKEETLNEEDQKQDTPRTVVSTEESRNSKSRRRLSRLTIKITPKRLNQWRQIRKPKTTEKEDLTDENEEEEEEEKLSPIKTFPNISTSTSIINDEADPLKTLTSSAESLLTSSTLPQSPEKSILQSESASSSQKSNDHAKSPSWWSVSWNVTVPGFRSRRANTDQSGAKSSIDPASNKLSFSASTPGTTSANSSPPPFSHHKDSNTSVRSENTEIVDSKSSTSIFHRKTRIWEKLTVESVEDEEETIRQFYLCDNYDVLQIVHVHSVTLAMESTADERNTPTQQDLSQICSKEPNSSILLTPTPKKYSPLHNFQTSFDSYLQDEKLDVVILEPEQIRSESIDYIDQGGDVISLNFYKTNHLILEAFNRGLKEDYFEQQVSEEMKIVRSSKSSNLPTKNGKGKKLTKRIHRGKSFPDRSIPRIYDLRYRHDRELLQNAMYTNFSEYK